jgi:putative hydrolase of the HAD superfamily
VRLRAVLFDVDGTLVDHDVAQQAGLDAVLAADGLVADAAALARWNDLVDTHYARYLGGELTFDEQRRERVRDMTGRVMDDEAADAWVARNVAGFEAALVLFDDVLPTLDRLVGLVPGLRLGAFSNVSGTFTRRKLEIVGLLDRFDVVLGIEDVGAPKPGPEPFWALCRALDVEPGEALHVGDRWAIDADAARAAGLLGVWLDRPTADPVGRRPPPGATATAAVPVVRTLLELVDLVREAA